ncbi:response regulator receiver domain-containing protein [Hephaestia caeni]|uniref:Response regulator receiver domain-containing protein n=1 Tax=Hephaestia caeni TaxID=645617 RepID=A0A397P9M0_9SPHN|nr:response regulator [Hephaestia caeni]RIA46250.1 response regulator receiver domain-containing protein [Hephaestia caeni]
MRAQSEEIPYDVAAVLVVEDEALVRAMAADILMDAGYRTFEASDAPDALAILEGRSDIGAVFTDIEMPGMTGLALAATIRDRWPRVSVLITSGRLRPSAGEMPTGADFIAKPYRPDELVAALGSMLF